MTTTEQFYVNYEFSDEKVNDSMELTEDRVIELLDAFYEFKTKDSIKEFEYANGFKKFKMFIKAFI